MKVKQVERLIKDGTEQKTKTHHNVDIEIDGDYVRLSGRKYAYLTEGRIQKINTTYNGSEFQLSMEVLAAFGAFRSGKFRLEQWWIDFE